MSERKLFQLLGALALLLIGGGLAMFSLDPAPEELAAVAPVETDCAETPDARPCLALEAAGLARTLKFPAARARFLAMAAAAARDDQRSAPLFDEAERIAGAIEQPDIHLMASLHVAVAMTRAGRPRGAALFAALAQDVGAAAPPHQAPPLTFSPLGGPSDQIARIVQAQITADDFDGAWNTAMAQEDGFTRAQALSAAAQALVLQGDASHAPRFVDAAVRAFDSITDRDAAAQAAVHVAGALGWAGRLPEAFTVAAQPDDVRIRGTAHLNIVEAAAFAGRIEDAEEAFGRIEDTRCQGQARWWILKAKAEAGDMPGAEALLGRICNAVLRNQAAADIAAVQALYDLPGALDRIADLPPEFYRGRGLRVVVVALIEAGRLGDAEEILDGLGDAGLRRTLTIEMVRARLKLGDRQAALALAREAADPMARAEALLTVAAGEQGLD